MRLVPPKWVEEGMTVIVPFTGVQASERTQALLGIKCSVLSAMGCHARVHNEEQNFSRMLHIDDLRVPEGDPHA